MANHYIENDAVISDCERYRYLLRRTWNHGQPRALLVMLNPSTADARLDDATIRSCVRLLSGMGYGSLEVVNCFAWRSTDPKGLATAPDPVGPMNDAVINNAIARCDVVICAWGAHPMAENRKAAILAAIREHRPAVYCFGKTKAGAPKHPLYIKSGTPLEAYP